MKKYFYTDGFNQFGPFTLDELRDKNISKDTKVWFEGMSEWLPAKDVAELNTLFENPPIPPIKTESSLNQPISSTQPSQTTTTNPYQSIRTKPKTWLVESILATVFCCTPLGIVGIINAASVESKYNRGDFEGAEKASAEAKKWITIAFICGIVFSLGYFLLIVVGGLAGEF